MRQRIMELFSNPSAKYVVLALAAVFIVLLAIHLKGDSAGMATMSLKDDKVLLNIGKFGFWMALMVIVVAGAIKIIELSSKS